MAYHQETEYSLVRDLLSRLENRTVLDIGAEKGTFIDVCLAAGAERVIAFEPYPPHVEHLRRRFDGVPTVTVLDVAIAAHDGDVALRIAHDPSGHPLDYHHSLIGFADTAEVRWSSTIPVTGRSLASLAGEGAVPSAVGLLKIDTEGGDLGVLQGLGSLSSDVVVVEYCWSPTQAAGHSPYRISDVAALLEPRGFRDFVFVKRHDELEVIEPGGSARPGDWGNLIFVHDRVRDRLMPAIQHAMTAAHDRLIDRALWFRQECTNRGLRIDELTERLGEPAPRPWIAAASPGERERLLSGRPKVSIVTPSFNQARFLEQTIQSVLDQDYANLEYVIIDGGSTDGSVEIIRRYADRLAYWVSERDRGQTDALNKGFARATGDIVAWVNSDDFYYPGAVSAAVDAFRTDPDLGLLYGRGNRVDEAGDVLAEFECQRAFNLEALVYGIDYILQPTTFMRRQALHEVGPFDPDLHYAFDWELWMRLGKRFPARMLDYLVAAGREYDSAKTFSGGFPRAEEIRRIVLSHTGRELTPGSLAYYLQTMHDALQRSPFPDGGRVEQAIGEAVSACHHLIAEDGLGPQATAPSTRRRTLAFADGWVGLELRLRRPVPPALSYLCLRGVHHPTVAAETGPLILRAHLNDRPLGFGVVAQPGPFTLAWPVTSEAIAGDAARASAVGEISISGPAVPAARLGAPRDPRILSYLFKDLTFETAPPDGAYIASGQSTNAADEVLRACRRAASLPPYPDGWAGPVLRQFLRVTEDAQILCLTGVHDERVASLRGPLTLSASVRGRPLGAAAVSVPGPFTLCWLVPPDAIQLSAAEAESEVVVASLTSIVPSEVWQSADRRALAFVFGNLSLRAEPPAGALLASSPGGSERVTSDMRTS